MLTSNSDCNQEFIITAINGFIYDSKQLIFSEILLIKCIKCDKTFNNIIENFKHFIDKHKSNEKSIFINELNDNNNDNKSIIRRKYENRNKFNKTNCNSINEKVKDRTNYIHKRFNCEFKDCHKCYTRLADLNKHKKIHSNPLICDLCDKPFPDNSTLKIHKRVHSGAKPFLCQWPGCDYKANQIGGVISHMRSHTGEKPYKCQFTDCSQSFAQQSALLAHIARSHESDRRLGCTWPGCDMSFAAPGGLKRHSRTHTGERPFACDWPGCDKRFTDASVLVGHKRTHTGEKPFGCDLCDLRFATYCTLGTHKKLVHKCDYIRRSRWDKRTNININ